MSIKALLNGLLLLKKNVLYCMHIVTNRFQQLDDTTKKLINVISEKAASVLLSLSVNQIY